MPIFLGHKTAELVLSLPGIELLSPSLDQGLEHCWANRRDFKRVDLSILEDIPELYDIIVSSPQELRTWDGIRCHLCLAHLPTGSFIELLQDVFVASPALCLVQRAQELTLPKTIALAELFCGTYTLDANEGSGVRERSPLTTLEELKSFYDRCGRVRGIDRARRALSLSLENSASPMETITRLVFCLPRSLGGFGFSNPLMNYEVSLNQRGRQISGKDFIKIDIFWKDFDFGLEYQGKYAHSSNTDIGEDIARQLAAEQKGIQLQMITIDQIREPAQRWEIARKISRCIGEPLPNGTAFQIANQRLVDELISAATT